jgi:hypothetical protein
MKDGNLDSDVKPVDPYHEVKKQFQKHLKACCEAKKPKSMVSKIKKHAGKVAGVAGAGLAVAGGAYLHHKLGKRKAGPMSDNYKKGSQITHEPHLTVGKTWK